jgi:hypothetical protein
MRARAVGQAEGLKLRSERLLVSAGIEEIFQLAGLLVTQIVETSPALSDPEVFEELTGILFRNDYVHGQTPHPHLGIDTEEIDIFTATGRTIVGLGGTAGAG